MPVQSTKEQRNSSRQVASNVVHERGKYIVRIWSKVNLIVTQHLIESREKSANTIEQLYGARVIQFSDETVDLNAEESLNPLRTCGVLCGYFDFD